MAAMESDALARLRSLLGDSFLAYTLDLAIESLDSPLSASQPGRLGVLNQLSMMMATHLAHEPDQRTLLEIQRTFDHYIPQARHSLPNVLRLHAGGSVAALEDSSDPVLALLLQQLTEAYPLLLLPQDGLFGIPSLSRLTWNLPTRDALFDALRADPGLKALYADATDGMGPMSTYHASTGQGGHIQLWGFVDQQLTTAFEWARFDSPTPSIEDVAARLKQRLEVLRCAVAGKTASVPMRVGLAGVLLPDAAADVDLGWGRVRRVDERDRAIMQRTRLGGMLQTTTPDGSTVSIDYAGDVVLTFDLPYKIVLGLNNDLTETPWPEELLTIQHLGAEAVENVRLGLALASTEADPLLIVSSWQVTLDPLGTGALLGWSDPRRASNLVPRQLDVEQVDAWAAWSKRVAEHRSKSTGVSVRRMLQALSERDNPEDVLVDAVVVWENLFGASQETTLRISSALAWLLGSDQQDRARRQAEYKKLYAIRSNIVHGSAKLDPKKVPEASRETVRISLEALRRMYLHRPDLLRETSSEARGNRLLLGDTG